MATKTSTGNPQNMQVQAPQPSSPPTAQSAAPPAAPPQALPPPSSKTNTMAILGFIFAFLFPIVGLILSIIGLNQAKARNEHGKELALAGLIISIVFMCLFVFIMFLGALSFMGALSPGGLGP